MAPVQLHPEQEFHFATYSVVQPSVLICTQETSTVEIAFFLGIESQRGELD